MGGKVIYSSPVQSSGKSPIQGGTPVVPEAQGGGSELPSVPEAGDQTSLLRSATLTVNVPADASVFVNGAKTKSVGSERTYVSRGLQSGFDYTYEIRAEVQRNGKTIDETKVVSLRAGQNSQLTFDLKAQASVATTLKLHVPKDAKVILAGNETSSSGALREFTTTKLASGKTWKTYTVRVTVNRDGETLAQEKTIELKAGSSEELVFDFDAPQVAAAR